jgi:hypothetical protein
MYERRVLNSATSELGSVREKPGGPFRPVRVSVTESASRDPAEYGVEEHERIEVFFLRDSEKGILEVSPATQFVRSSEFDQDNRPFTFNGSIVEKGEHYLRAEFSRVKISHVRRG